MDKYLDSNGLSRLWTKIKDTFAKKKNGSYVMEYDHSNVNFPHDGSYAVFCDFYFNNAGVSTEHQGRYRDFYRNPYDGTTSGHYINNVLLPLVYDCYEAGDGAADEYTFSNTIPACLSDGSQISLEITAICSSGIWSYQITEHSIASMSEVDAIFSHPYTDGSTDSGSAGGGGNPGYTLNGGQWIRLLNYDGSNYVSGSSAYDGNVECGPDVGAGDDLPGAVVLDKNYNVLMNGCSVDFCGFQDDAGIEYPWKLWADDIEGGSNWGADGDVMLIAIDGWWIDWN